MSDNILKRQAFQKAENNGRTKALSALKKIELIEDFNDYKIIQTNEWCKWDFEVRDNLTNELLAIIEAKDRFMDSTDRKLIYGGAQLEAKKFEILKEKAIEQEINAFYICTYTDNTYYIWDIVNCNGITEDKRMCNKTTAVLTEKIEKHCYYFPMRNAKFKGKI